jgi:uncharacterized protein YbaA (DUF1428 family)
MNWRSAQPEELNMAYVDGFLITVPAKNLAAYRKMSQKAGQVWMEHGAIDYKECVGDDLKIPGVHSTFPKMLRTKRTEAIVFSWIVYASKAERNRILKLAMADPRLATMPDPMPFDPKRMLFGGFDVLVDMAPGAAKKGAAKKRPMPKKKSKSSRR